MGLAARLNGRSLARRDIEVVEDTLAVLAALQTKAAALREDYAAADVTARRQAFGLRPGFAMVDTCAAEFASSTPYLSSTWEEEVV